VKHDTVAPRQTEWTTCACSLKSPKRRAADGRDNDGEPWQPSVQPD